tara:strand:+ start:1486 stop:1740 length:255 start_codon:yes stop_codon:yes gene_type:complete
MKTDFAFMVISITKCLKEIMDLESNTKVTEPEEPKPLMVWFEMFLMELDLLHGDYKNIEPTDMLEFYYADTTPADAASKLMLES